MPPRPSSDRDRIEARILNHGRKMAVSCSGCGRHYDVSLFQFGRTISCACGERVSRDVEERRLSPLTDPLFFCDSMLGRLARWLRALGFDTAYDPEIDDATLVRRAWEEGRWILTCDRRLSSEWRVRGCVVLQAEAPLDRLREVVTHFGIEEPRRLFGRCLECNEPLEALSWDDVGREGVRIPERVRRAHHEFSRCLACGRVYWEGSHTRRMRRRLEEIFPGEGLRE
jgi:uncharacterized protein with PIN domain